MKGAREALLLVSEYTQFHRDGEPVSPDVARRDSTGLDRVKVRQWDALVLAPGGVTVDVRLAAPAKVFPSYEEEFRSVIESLEIMA